MPGDHAVRERRAAISAPDHRIVAEAADWLVRLEEGALGQVEQQRLATWRGQSPEHERAWQAAMELKGLIDSVPDRLGASVLGRQRPDRRTLLKSLAVLMVAAPAWMAYRRLPWQAWSADYRTAAGEQQPLTLPDGSRLLLNTATAVDVAFDATTRHLLLHQGEILVETAPDPAAIRRPFIVQTSQGRIRALGTRFTVRQACGGPDTRIRVVVLDQAVAIRPAQVDGATCLEAGQQADFSRTRAPVPAPAPRGEPAWTRGRIVADRMRLGDFVAELARYRPGILRCDPAVADLYISGVFQIRDTDQVLNLVAETLPVQVSRVTGYWVTLAPQL